MRFRILNHKLLVPFIASVFLVGGIYEGSAHTNIGGEWTSYPAADIYNHYPAEQLSQALSTPRYDYFVIRGMAYKKNKFSYTAPELDLGREFNALYRYDREHPEKGMYSANRELPLSGNLIQTVRYSPKSGKLAVGYDTGVIDIISDAGDITVIESIPLQPLPTSRTINSITFSSDGATIYVCHDLGMMSFDTSTGKCLTSFNTSKSPHYAAGLGDKILWVAPDETDTTRLYLLPGDTAPVFTAGNALETTVSAGFDHLCLNSSGGVADAQVLMPLSDKSIMFAGNVGVASYCPIVLTLGMDGEPVFVHLPGLNYTDSKAGTNVNATHSYPIETLTGNYREGYLLNSSGAIMLVKTGVDPDLTSGNPADDFCRRACTLLSKNTLNASVGKLTDEEHRLVASWDGETFMSLNTKVGFFTRTVTRAEDAAWDAAVVWSKRSEDIPLEGNPLAVPTTISYHPEKGMLFSGNQYDSWNIIDMPDQPANICAFKDEKWEYLDLYPKNYSAGRLQSRTRGLAVDPLDTDKYYSTHYYYGLLRRSFSEPEKIVYLSMPGMALTSLKGYVNNAFPGLPSGKYINFTEPAFDSKNRLWIAPDYPNGEYDGNIYLLSWDGESRMNCTDIYDNHSLINDNGFNIITVPGKRHVRRHYLYPLQSEGFSNTLLYIPYAYSNLTTQPFFYDHNGTLDDTSDDRMVSFSDFRIYGGQIKVSDTYYLTVSAVEDLENGEVWIITDQGPFYCKLSEVFLGNPVLYPVELESDGDVEPTFAQDFYCRYIQIDSLGRKWIGVSTGLMCLSPDHKKLLGFWNSENSPITNDRVLGMNLDPVTNDIWLATYGTLYRFRPEGSELYQDSPRSISCSPQYLTPDFLGEMSFTGLKEGTRYTIVDPAGKSAFVLPDARSGRASWHPASIGTLNTGVYELQNSKGETVFNFKVLKR